MSGIVEIKPPCLLACRNTRSRLSIQVCLGYVNKHIEAYPLFNSFLSTVFWLTQIFKERFP